MSNEWLTAAAMLDGSWHGEVENAPMDLIGGLLAVLGLPFSSNVRQLLDRLARGEVPPAPLAAAARADVRAVTATCEDEPTDERTT